MRVLQLWADTQTYTHNKLVTELISNLFLTSIVIHLGYLGIVMHQLAPKLNKLFSIVFLKFVKLKRFRKTNLSLC